MALIIKGVIRDLAPKEIFVFGSNLAGIHGKGAAALARKRWGASYGTGRGLMGQSYALPTKTGMLEARTVPKILAELITLAAFATARPDLTFYLTAIGTGEAGLSPLVMRRAAIKANLPSNVLPWWTWDGSEAPATPAVKQHSIF